MIFISKLFSLKVLLTLEDQRNISYKSVFMLSILHHFKTGARTVPLPHSAEHMHDVTNYLDNVNYLHRATPQKMT